MQWIRSRFVRKRALVRRGLCLAYVCAAMCGGLRLHAQTPASTPPAYPQHPKSGEWFFDAPHHKVWRFVDGEWWLYPVDNVRSMTPCNGHLILKTGFHYLLARADGTVIEPKAPAIRCMDAFTVIGNPSRIEYLINAEGDTVSALVDNCKIYSDSVRGERVYCFPMYMPGLERYNCFDLKNWGMMNTDGTWMIEPKYDKPFQFQNGEAAVILKGDHLRIDEDGNVLKD